MRVQCAVTPTTEALLLKHQHRLYSLARNAWKKNDFLLQTKKIPTFFAIRISMKIKMIYFETSAKKTVIELKSGVSAIEPLQSQPNKIERNEMKCTTQMIVVCFLHFLILALFKWLVLFGNMSAATMYARSISASSAPWTHWSNANCVLKAVEISI